jgi:hypothetical protein
MKTATRIICLLELMALFVFSFCRKNEDDGYVTYFEGITNNI